MNKLNDPHAEGKPLAPAEGSFSLSGGGGGGGSSP